MAARKPFQRSIQQSSVHLKSRFAVLKFLVICLPFWVSVKFYDGPHSDLVRNYLACILFLICCALIIQLVLPRLSEAPLLIGLFLFFCAVELANWRVPGLFDWVSVTLVEQKLIGGVYSLNKIPYFGVGAFIGYFILKACRVR